MRAIITVVGLDMVGIIAKVSTLLMGENVNIQDISQTVFDDLFAMTMLADISKCQSPISSLSEQLDALGQECGLKIHIMHEDIFNSMHRI